MGIPAKSRIRVENKLPSNSQYTYRLVVVQTAVSSPGDTTLTLDVVDLNIDCYAGTDEMAAGLAEMVRSALRLRFVRHIDPVSGAFIKSVETLARPAWAPWDDASAIERWTAAYRLTVHATP
ncbi:hypothetical protein [Polymorphospora sp. A560]